MNSIQNFINLVRKNLESVIRFLRPPKELSWKVPVWLSVFSWLMSTLALSGLLRGTLVFVGWLFLIFGVGWFLTDHPIKKVLGFPLGFSIGPWITGALACLFLFNAFGEENVAAAFVFWPLISAAIATIPAVLTPALTLKTPPPPVRQKIVLMVMINLVLSCWLQFHFLIQGWLQNYPSLMANYPNAIAEEFNNFDNSVFVVEVGTDVSRTSKGEDVLAQAEIFLKADLDNRPWPSVERWLLNLRDQIPILEERAMKALPETAENSFWTLYAPRPTSEKAGYDLQLLAIWNGPTARGDSYSLAKTCRIMPRTASRSSRSADTPPAQNARVDCDPKNAFISGLPFVEE